MKNLTNQIYVYSVDTSAFYNKNEQVIDAVLSNRRVVKSHLESLGVKKLKSSIDTVDLNNKIKWNNNERHIVKSVNVKTAIRTVKYVSRMKETYSNLEARISQIKEDLKYEFSVNEDKRVLREELLDTKSAIGLFESTLTRTLGLEGNKLTRDIIIVRAYYFNVLEDIIVNGFVDKLGEEYRFFSASAGQLRNKKGVMIKKSVWEKYEKTLTCGLTLDDINVQGGMNTTKYLAYLSLSNSATNVWKGFNIDRCIVVDDMETEVEAEVDHIDHENNFTITRKEMPIEINHTDGCGMILANKKNTKAFMCRLPWMKGLLIPTPFDKFAKDVAKNNKVTDIYGKEWDIKKDRIEVIFTKSQFKMWKYYTDWKEYQDNFKLHNCEASKLNEEESNIRDAKLNYQMLQTLTSMKTSELKTIAESTIKDIENLGNDQETMLRVLGADSTNESKNNFQQALSLYPELLNDIHAKEVIKDKKVSIIKEARAGKLNIEGKYTFVSPDMYAFCEWLFKGDKNPNGLLANDEVYCNLYGEQTLNLLRSPHLYKEHALRQNVLSDVDGIKKSDWFVSNAVYTSNKDVISKILQFDVDGDKLLVCSDKTVIDVAKRDMEGIVPLYYEMAKAGAQQIDTKVIYDSMTKAYSANIGEISNKITKIFNSDEIDLDMVKILTMYNNFIIDFAKSGFKPDVPKHIKKKMKKYNKMKAPHFFQYAKDKKLNQVEESNNSVVNRLKRIIPNKRIKFEDVAGNFDYKMLMKVKSRKIDETIVKRYTELNRSKTWLMKNDENIKSQDKLYVYVYIREELLKLHDNPFYIADVLVNHLYKTENSKFKTTLWESFGEELVINLKKNVGKKEICLDCENRYEVTKQRQVRCEKCQKKREKALNKKSQQKSRENKKAVS